MHKARQNPDDQELDLAKNPMIHEIFMKIAGSDGFPCPGLIPAAGPAGSLLA
jgi:hypothetical protein